MENLSDISECEMTLVSEDNNNNTDSQTEISPHSPEWNQRIQCTLPYSTTPSNRYNTQTEGFTPSFDICKMAEILYGPDFTRSERLEVYNVFDQPELLEKRLYTMDKFAARKFVEKQAKIIMSNPIFHMTRTYVEPIKIVHRISMCGMLNCSVGTKAGVQQGLFGATVADLGTERHKHLLGDIERLDLAGGFLMTEIEHGSNVKGVQTTATYDKATQEFVMNTPNKGAIKWWIGNAALTGQAGVVFARLIIDNTDYGVHPFLVPLRDLKSHTILPGVVIGDCGDKTGLPGVDNGFVAFKNVRIPRENYLNKLADVFPDGTYKTPFLNEDKRFGALLGRLITGRISLCVTTMNSRRIAATIATRYAHRRKQFGPTEAEVPIIEYPSHLVRLMPIIASCFADEFALQETMRRFSKLYLSPQSQKYVAEVHALAAGMKSTLTWDSQRYLQTMRELCGGNGYSANNQIGVLLQDNDILQTYEGDNTVLVQQMGSYLLKEYSKQFTGNWANDAVTFIRKEMGILALCRNPVVTRMTFKSHLRSTQYHLQAFEYRTAKLLNLSATVFKRYQGTKGDFTAWALAVPTMVKLCRAYTEQFALEQFAKVLEEISDKKSPIYEALKICCDVYALSIMERNAGEFADILRGGKPQAISKVFEQCCIELKKYSLSLVDSFEIPDFLIDAPLGLSKGNYIDNTLHYLKTRNPHNEEAFQLLSKL